MAQETADGYRAVVISGNPSPTGSSGRLAKHILGLLEVRGWQPAVVEVGDLPSDALLGRGEDPRIAEAMAAIEGAQVVIVATPVYRAAYSGLLKVFCDLMPPAFFAGKVCVPVATGRARAHLLMIDHALRPLFASLEGVGAVTGVYAVPEDFVDGAPRPELEARLAKAAEEAVRLSAAMGGVAHAGGA